MNDLHNVKTTLELFQSLVNLMVKVIRLKKFDSQLIKQSFCLNKD